MNNMNIKEILKKNTMLIVLFAVMALFQILIMMAGKGSLFSPSNLSNLINQNSYVVILSIGMLICILTGGNIDLSIGSVVALIGALAGTLIVSLQMNIYLATVICLFVGILIGAWQGFWIAYVRIPAFIVTLAGMLLWRGVALLILNGQTISPFPQQYLRFFTNFIPNTTDKATVEWVTIAIGIAVCLGYILLQVVSQIRKKRKQYQADNLIVLILKMVFVSAIVLSISYQLGHHKGFPVILILLCAVYLAYDYYTSKTVPGRHVYAMGGNEKAAILSGINTNKVLFLAYTNMAFLAAVAALVCVARFNSAAPTAGINYELDAIGACYIGGASAYGGVGTVGGTAIGAVFMGVLNNGMSILGVDANWQKAVKGIVLLAAVIFDVISKKKSKA